MCSPHHHLVTTAGLRAGGVGRRHLNAMLEAGRLTRLRPGVFARPEACDTVRAAAVHGGPLACTSAARHSGLWILDESPIVHVWLGAHGHGHSHRGCSCVEHWDEGPIDSFGLPSVPRMLRQILACCGIEHFFVALESALHQGLLTRAGIAWLRTTTNDAARDAIAFARKDAESGLESLLRWRLRHRGIRVRAQVTIVGVGRVDFLVGERLILEVDGRLGHVDDDRHKDLVRDANATMWGYTTLRFDYAMVVHDWDLVERAILARLP